MAGSLIWEQQDEGTGIMFTTGNHLYLYTAVAGYALAMLLHGLRVDRAAFACLLAGFALDTLYLMGRGWLGGCFIPNAMVEGPFFLPWCLAGVAVMKRTGNRDRGWGLLLIPVVVFSIFALVYPKGIIPPTPKKVTGWATCFFVSEVMAHALFYCGALYAAALLWRKQDGNTHESYIIWGFVAYSVAQVVGAVWSFLGWGNTFNWSSRHLGSAAIWILYAAYLHLKFLPGWHDRKRAVFAVAGAFFVFLVTYANYFREMSFPRIGG